MVWNDLGGMCSERAAIKFGPEKWRNNGVIGEITEEK
jgi:hypothetical protein